MVQAHRKKRGTKNINLHKLDRTIRLKMEKVMIHKTFFALILPFAFLSAMEQPVKDTSKMTGIIMNVVMNQEDSIAGLNGNRLYLKAQNIFHSKNGYILRGERSVIVLPSLSFDENGEGYLLCRSPEDFQLVCTNSKCGFVFWFSDTWNGRCPKCGWIGN